MKVIVIGANGDVGEHVVRKLSEKNIESLAVVATENQIEDLKKLGASNAVVYDEQNLLSHLQSSDAVIYLTGVNPKKHTSKTVMVDHQSVSDTIQLAQESGVKRFVMMSAVKAEESENETSRKIAAKDLPEDILKSANLVYTVIRPGQLTDNPGTELIEVKNRIHDKTAEIPREDVAALLVASLDHEAVFNKTIEVSSGDTPIHDALNLV
ncbi:NAD(P)H-binding protein [Bacillus sp. ISL-47]|uniref:NAD(P)H-binding protein n=1 Tax=Bacillus sp. ISL-47 TaxID=2819130 RepID=UPI001BE62EF4|nr:NAD(P)H-binding protein [Bacillus sp. ISL-47]MBT2688802.1 NAD(P)H-binding protein [Bacillus sp. ISL-47]MBT2710309.1 NAD(P)H-binding protein [Pseudomonas sp. ISL-84]